MNFLSGIKDRLRPATSRYISRAALVEGVVGDSKKSLRCLLVGSATFMKFLSDRTFSETPRWGDCSRVWIGALDRLVTRYRGKYDICVAVAPKRYDDRFRRLYDFRCDVCVGQSIDVSGTIDEIKKNFHKTKRQVYNNLLSKSKFTYRISDQLTDFERFYRDMFVPHIAKRHGGALIESYEEMKPHFLKGFLLLVACGGETIAGALCVPKGETLVFRRTGVLGGDEKYVRLGAQNALYLFMILHAKERGFRFLDTMKSLSILNDGVYVAKREWGAAVYADEESRSRLYFIFPKCTESVVGFFQVNPFIVHSRDGLSGVIGLDWDGRRATESAMDLRKKYYAPGIDQLLVLTPGSEKPAAVSFQRSD